MQREIPVYINYGIGRFLPMLEQFGQFLKSVPLQSFKATTSQEPVGIIVSPRNNSGIPFCNMALALLYAARGFPVTIIWDDLEFLDPEWDTQQRSVDLLVKAISKYSNIDFIQLSLLECLEIDEADRVRLETLAFHNAIWNVRNLVPSAELDAYASLSFEAMCKNAGYIKQLYATHRFDHCVHQSLVNNNGGMHKYFANQHGQRVGCFDVAGGRGLIGLEDVHGYFYDSLNTADPLYKSYLFADETLRKKAIVLARENFHSRLHGRDDRSTQPTSDSAQSVEKFDIVIPMNIFWDAAALGRDRLFETPYDWLLSTISYILFQTPFSVALRQHPHEKQFLGQFKTGTLLGEALENRFEGHPRFRFISCTEPINTYHLIEDAKIVLPYTSTIGIEAALMGKHVVVASNVYYVDQPFVHKAASVEDYFSQIKEVDSISLSEESKEAAWLLYFLVTMTPYMYVPFGLDPADVQKWTAAGFKALNDDEQLDMAIHCLASNTPFSYPNGERIIKEALASEEHINELDFAHHP